MSDELEQVADDIVNFADDEQAQHDNDRETAIANVLFEWQAYYGRGDLPEYVNRFRDQVAQKILQRKANDDLRIDKLRVPAGNNAYAITVGESELKDEMDEKIKAELAKRGEPV